MKNSKKNTYEEPANTMGWLTTFNDMITLLMVFFVLLYTMGSIDTKSMMEFKNALQGGLGIMNQGKYVTIGIIEPILPSSLKDTKEKDEKAKRTLDPKAAEGEGDEKTEAGEKPSRENREASQLGISPKKGEAQDKKLAGVVSVLDAEEGIRAELISEGARIRLENRVLFDLGVAAINPEGLPVLDKVGNAVLSVPNRVRVEGHTDNIPINTYEFPSNWELSTARAVNVLKILINRYGIDPRRLSAAGYGESKSVAGNDTPENRAKNRRVEIVLISEKGSLDVQQTDVDTGGGHSGADAGHGSGPLPHVGQDIRPGHRSPGPAQTG